MGLYILKRLLLIIPTLFLILLINFAVVQIAPGGPVEQAIQRAEQFQGIGVVSGSTSHINEVQSHYQGTRGLSPEMIEQIKAQYGFDRPVHERFFQMLKGYFQLDFGTSFFKNKSVTTLILEKMPVTISLGLWSTLLIYSIAIPLGISKAKRHGSLFDQTTSLILAVGYAVPTFVFAILLIMIFSGGSYLQWLSLIHI